MRVLIMGAGGMGGYLGWLASHGMDVGFVPADITQCVVGDSSSRRRTTDADGRAL